MLSILKKTVINVIFRIIEIQTYLSVKLGTNECAVLNNDNCRLQLTFFFYGAILNLREVFVGTVPRHYFNDFAVFQPRDFNGSGPASVNFSSLLRQRPPPFSRRIPGFQLWSFYIRSRFTAPRKEVVRFSTFEAYFVSSRACFFFLCVTRGSRNSTLMAIYNMEGCTICARRRSSNNYGTPWYSDNNYGTLCWKFAAGRLPYLATKSIFTLRLNEKVFLAGGSIFIIF